ncbi:MAG: macro domain-containing protein [Clostridia bacterium]|nr:macro domain-containing protein [Clostridia bacterium]
MPFQIVRNDVTKMKTDVVVNAANSHLRNGSGVCGAVFNAAGKDKLAEACRKIGHCSVGSAVVTPGFDLCKYIIHTVGPIWKGGFFGEKEKLASCYRSVLELASELKAESVAIPLISSGVYGYPKDKAMKVAVETIVTSEHLPEMDIYLVLFDKNAVRQGKKYSKIQEFIDETYIEEYPYARRASLPMAQSIMLEECKCKDNFSIEDVLSDLDESFSEALLRMIDERGLKDSEVYKKANIDRKLFSKIRNNKDYKPRKNTVIAFAIALELSLKETNAFLEKAGFVLSHSNKADVIIEYFIKNEKYDIFEINEALFEFDQPLLGC